MIETLIKAWVGYCRAVLGLEWTVTRAEAVVGSGAVRPPGPYVTLKIISGPNDYSIDDELIFDCNGKGKIFSQKGFVLSVQAFREGHNDALNTIKTQISNPEYAELLKKDGKISVTTRGSVTDISRQLETGYEPRSAMDINFCVRFAFPSEIGTLERVVGVEQVNGQ